MNNIQKYSKALNIASSLLFKNGEVSMSEIESLPFLDRDFDPKILRDALIQMYDVEIINRKIPSTSYLNWENIIRLRVSQS